MSTTIQPFLFPMSIIIIIAIVLLARIINTPKQPTTKSKQYARNSTYQKYTSHFSPKMEFDIRLPYKRFKQLHPNYNITYEEYKKLQTQSAFKHSISSQQNHRMVR